MKRSSFLNQWLRTRQLRYLWGSIPVLLAFAAWLVFGFCQLDWRHRDIKTQYATLSQRALERRDFDTARVSAQRLLSLNADPRSQWLFNLALALAGSGRQREAASLFSTVAPADKPGYMPAHIFLAQSILVRTNLTTNEVRIAEQHLIHALSLDPKFFGANELLAQVYIRTGQWELASERLREVVAVRPESSLLLALVLKARGDLAGARSWAERAAKYHREKVENSKIDEPLNRRGWAQALVMTEDYAKAVDILEKGWNQSGVREYPSQIGEVCATWSEALVRTRPDDVETRVAVVQKGLQYTPDNELLLKHLVRVSQFTGPQAEPARQTLNRLLAQGKSVAIIHFALGLDAWQRGQSDLAREHFSLSYKAAPKMPDVANNMAMSLATGEKADLERGLAIIQSVVKDYPGNPNFRETQGQLLLKLGRCQEAVTDLEYALPLLGPRPNTHSALAQAYKSLGSDELAAQHQKLAQAYKLPANSP
jgi:Flp pilus assembly protein TadD